MKKTIQYLTAHPAIFFTISAIIAFFALCYINEYRDPDGFKWHDVIVESHGVLFDLFVFGILLSIYEVLRENKEKIERLNEEIDDYRGWNRKDAMYRIVGAIKRLNNLGVSEINLNSCYLRGADLRGADLRGADLRGADLRGADLRKRLIPAPKIHQIVGFKHYISEMVKWKIKIMEMERQRKSINHILLGAIVELNWYEIIEKWNIKGLENIQDELLIEPHTTFDNEEYGVLVKSPKKDYHPN